MPSVKEAAAEFLARKRVAVTGVPRNPKGHGSNIVYQRLRARGYAVFAVNPNADVVEGDACYHDLTAIPGGVDAVVIGTRPAIAETTMRECAALGIKHVRQTRASGRCHEAGGRRVPCRRPTQIPPAERQQTSVYVEGARPMEQRTDTPSGAPSVSGRGPSEGGAGRPQAGLQENKEAMPQVTEREMKARVSKILNRWPAVGLAVGVVRNGSLEFFYGHGMADIASNTPITEDTVFRIASITKTFTAIAVMQLWEQGLLDLDAPANDYLRAYKLIPAKANFRPATVRHLLTHTAGIPQMVLPARALTTVLTGSWLTEGGESFALGQPLPTLAEYYRGGLRLVAEPGTRFTYGNHGFATLGQLVEDVSGTPLDRYFREHIFAPLGMADTDLLRSERVTSRLATGYSLRSTGTKAVTDRAKVTAGASSIYSTPRDMARYVAALLGGGANEHGSVLKPATMATMFAPHYQTDPRVPGIGLAFFRANLGGHLAVEHPGILPGFNSQIFVAPDDGVGVMAFTNGARGALMWLTAEVGRLLESLLGVPDAVIRTDVPQRPDLWGDICGWYPVSAQLTDMQARALAGLGAEVFVRRGQLMLRGLSPLPVQYRGFPLHPDDDKDPYVFRIDLSQFGIGTCRIVFSQEPGVGTTGVHTDFVPLSLRKQPASKNPRLWITGGLGALALATAARAVRRPRSRPYKGV